MSNLNKRRKNPKRSNYKIRECEKYAGSYESTFDLNLLGFENNVPVLTIVKDENISKKKSDKTSQACNVYVPQVSTTSNDHNYTDIVGPSHHFYSSPKTNNTCDHLNFCKDQKCDSIYDTKSLWQINFFEDLKNCTQFDLTGNLPIHCAIISNNLNLVLRQCIALYIRYKTIDVHNFGKLTPIQMAVKWDCYFEILHTLIHYKADPFVIDDNGNTLIHLAILHLNESSLKMLLLIKEFDLNVSNFKGETPLILCVLNKKWGHAHILLASGADPNLSDKCSGRCPLFHAIENDDLIMVKTLLEFGALTRVYNFGGVTPLDIIVNELSTVSNGVKNLVFQNLQLQSGRKQKKVIAD